LAALGDQERGQAFGRRGRCLDRFGQLRNEWDRHLGAGLLLLQTNLGLAGHGDEVLAAKVHDVAAPLTGQQQQIKRQPRHAADGMPRPVARNLILGPSVMPLRLGAGPLGRLDAFARVLVEHTLCDRKLQHRPHRFEPMLRDIVCRCVRKRAFDVDPIDIDDRHGPAVPREAA
jgi:hypothetical protein